MIRKNPENIPECPGVYIFRSRKKGVLYIGKALNLKKRTEAYFSGKSHVSSVDLPTESDELEYIVTQTEKDALLLEFNLIKEYNPTYNIKLKDDRSFLFLELSLTHEFPGLQLKRGVLEKDNFYFGPLINGRKGRELLDKLATVFGIRQCSNRKLSEGRFCVYYYMGSCSGPCESMEAKRSYQESVNMAFSFLKGKTGSLMEKLKSQMKGFSANLEFEAAQKKKELIDFFNSREAESYIISASSEDYDGLACYGTEERFFFFRFSVTKGAVMKREFESIPLIHGKEKPDLVREYIFARYSGERDPKEINLYENYVDLEVVGETLSRIRNRKISLRVPARGRKRRIVELAELNLMIRIRQNHFESVAEKVRQILGLSKKPKTIEAVDISHLSEENRVGAIVHFSEGNPVKLNYRNYRIKGTGGGDPGAIKEVLTRRGDSEVPLPDLMIVDGGAPQIGVALEVKKRYSLNMDIVALAKREEEVYTETGEVVKLPPGSPELFLFQNIRDEVHRRAVSYHRKLREKL